MTGLNHPSCCSASGVGCRCGASGTGCCCCAELAAAPPSVGPAGLWSARQTAQKHLFMSIEKPGLRSLHGAICGAGKPLVCRAKIDMLGQ